MTGWNCAGAIAFALMASPIALAGQTAQVGAPALDRGARVYAAQKCSQCHSLDGKAGRKRPLDTIGTGITAEEIRLWIVDPLDMAKKTESPHKATMKSYKHLGKEDLDALVAFLAAKRKK
jgi:mono/diheme cytochrome c family protein